MDRHSFLFFYFPLKLTFLRILPSFDTLVFFKQRKEWRSNKDTLFGYGIIFFSSLPLGYFPLLSADKLVIYRYRKNENLPLRKRYLGFEDIKFLEKIEEEDIFIIYLYMLLINNMINHKSKNKSDCLLFARAKVWLWFDNKIINKAVLLFYYYYYYYLRFSKGWVRVVSEMKMRLTVRSSSTSRQYFPSSSFVGKDLSSFSVALLIFNLSLLVEDRCYFLYPAFYCYFQFFPLCYFFSRSLFMSFYARVSGVPLYCPTDQPWMASLRVCLSVCGVVVASSL